MLLTILLLGFVVISAKHVIRTTIKRYVITELVQLQMCKRKIAPFSTFNTYFATFSVIIAV